MLYDVSSVPRVVMPYVVLDKLLGGADLMLPGIYTNSFPTYWDSGDVSLFYLPFANVVTVSVWGHP